MSKQNLTLMTWLFFEILVPRNCFLIFSVDEDVWKRTINYFLGIED